VQVGLAKNPHMPNVPFIFDYAKSDEDRQILRLVFGWLDLERPIGAPPGVPEERLRALREGFDRAMKDSALLADAEKAQVGIEPMSGAAIAAFVDEAYRARRSRQTGRPDAGTERAMIASSALELSALRSRFPPAQPKRRPSSSFTSRIVNLVVGFNPGGAYDPYARAVALHLPKHLPGAPDIVVKNMQGAGSVRAANYLYNVAPKDGSELGLIAGSAALEPMFGVRPTQFEGQGSAGSAAPTTEPASALPGTRRPSLGRRTCSKELVLGTSGTRTSIFRWRSMPCLAHA
jgi:hypothetical protein